MFLRPEAKIHVMLVKWFGSIHKTSTYQLLATAESVCECNPGVIYPDTIEDYYI